MSHRILPRLAGLVLLALHLGAATAGAKDYFIFRVRGRDIQVTNPSFEALKDAWQSQKATITSQWVSAVDAQELFVDLIFTSFTIDLRDTSVTLPDVPAISISQGAEPGTTLNFFVSVPVDWSTRVCGPATANFFYKQCGWKNYTQDFHTTITVSGSIKLDQDSGDGRYFLVVTSIEAESHGSTLFDWAVDPIIAHAVNDALKIDQNGNGVADVSERVYFTPLQQDFVAPIYTKLSADGAVFPFSLTTENDIPVVTVRFGSPIVGDWLPSRTEHPRLLYTAAERPTILARKTDNFRGWYDSIRSTANTDPAFSDNLAQFHSALQCADVEITSEDDWSVQEVSNARIALSAALAFDLEGTTADLHRALAVLLKFTDSICDPLFEYQWGQNSLYAAEVLTDLTQAYDLLQGHDLRNVLTRDDYLQNTIGLPTLDALIVRVITDGDPSLKNSYEYVVGVIDKKFRRLRDVMNLETHAWDLAGVPNISIRNAAALGMSALLFNQQPDAYENISLATSIIWKQLGVASSLPFSDDRLFTKAVEGEGFAEGPHYLNYAADLYLPFLLAYDKFTAGEQQPQKLIYNDWVQQYGLDMPSLLTSQRVQRMQEWALKLVMPDGTSPAIKDANPGEFFYSGLLANPRATPDLNLRSVWTWHFANTGYPVGGRLIDIFVAFDDAMLASQQPPATRYASPTIMLPDAGNAVFRNGWDPNAIYMHVLGDHAWVSGGTLGGTRLRGNGHQQQDNSSFLIHAYGEDLAIDSGYGNYPVRAAVAGAVNHNLVLVDGEGPTAFADAVMTSSLDTLMIDRVQVTTGYEGITDKRDILFLDNRYFVVVDDLAAASSHQYEWKLHLNGTGVPALFGGGFLWTTPGGQQLKGHVTTSAGGVDGIDVDQNAPNFTHFTTDPHEVSFHTALAARANAARNLRYVAMLVPSNIGASLPTTTDFSDRSTFAGIRLQMTNWIDLVIVKNPDHIGFFTVNGAYTGGYGIVSDAEVLWLRLNATDRRLISFFGRDMTSFAYNGVPYVTSPVASIASVIGDIDGDGDVDDVDVKILLADLNKRVEVSRCGAACDLDHNGIITIVDARSLTTLCTRAGCAQR